ncbi:MAG: hypothetical protein Q7U38_02000, partial [Methylobacter sp.]|nr:hypothetical protein [Methylobacter sp.]
GGGHEDISAVHSLVLFFGYQQNAGQTFQVFTGAAPGGSSTSAIHGSRKTWKVYFGMLVPL